MAKRSKVKMVSITYKIGRKTFTITPKTKKAEKPDITSGSTAKSMLSKSPAIDSNEDFMCINGELHIKICVGTSCDWFPTGESC